MKKIFTTAVVLCIAMQIGSFAQKPKVFAVNKAEQHHQEKLAELKKAQETKQDVTPIKPSGLLKSAQAKIYPVSMEGFTWYDGAWQSSSETQYDTQGRPTQQVYGNSRQLWEYTDGKTVVYSQTRANEVSPWVNQSKQVNESNIEGYLSEYFLAEPSGEWVLVDGYKSSAKETVDGNTTTHENMWWSYNSTEMQYLVDYGYKNVIEKLPNGNFLSQNSYDWGGEGWVLRWSQEYVYNESGRLDALRFYNGEDEGNSRIELVYNGSEEPDMAYEYSVNAEGTVSVLRGRYIDLVWYEWVANLKEGELEPLSGIEQVVVDPDGDKNDAANYVNREKFSSGEGFHYSYTWIGGEWVLTEEYKEELQPEGTILVTEYWMDYDEELEAFVGGDKYIELIDGDKRTETRYIYDTENLTWIPISKEEVTVLFGGDGEERTDYVYVGGENEWQKEYYYKWVVTIGLDESKRENYEAGSLTSYFHSLNEYDIYGNTTRSVTDDFWVSSQYNSETEEDEPVNNFSYEEELFDNVYEDAKLMLVTMQRRNSKEGVFVNQSKYVYSYTPTGVGSLTEIALMEVVSTIVDNTLLIKANEPGVVELVDARGKVCAKQQVQVGLTQIPVSNLAKGVYFVKMTSVNGRSQTVKVIKK